MLDQIHGLFPHVTRSDTTSRRALELLRSIGWTGSVDIHYVTRCYQTRHGNGPMSSATPVQLRNADAEANVDNEFQGGFRVAELDPSLLRYALRADAAYHDGHNVRRHLMVTCLDQRPGFSVDTLLSELDITFASVAVSFGPTAATVETWSARAADLDLIA